MEKRENQSQMAHTHITHNSIQCFKCLSRLFAQMKKTNKTYGDKKGIYFSFFFQCDQMQQCRKRAKN